MIGRRPPGDHDLGDRTQTIAILSLCGLVGPIFGGALAKFFGWNIFLGALVLGPPIDVLLWLIAHLVVEGSGRVARMVFDATGDGTPYGGGLSREEALIAAGRLEDAIAALGLASERDPADPRPPRRLAELYRDELGDPEEAVRWYRRAAAVPGITDDSERMILREIVEICTRRIGRPELAAPALARTAELHAGDRLGHWARTELRRIRSRELSPP